MCGLAGFIDESGFAKPESWPALLAAMCGAIRHRGPDDEGQFVDTAAGLGFAFRRLSIIDLSPAGHQPMESRDGRFVLMFNGEVYNFVELRAELVAKGHAFRGHSDTEVMLAAFTEWGVAAATARFNGMFAYALWDRANRALHLVRDRLGEKPLYYGWSNGVLLFGSELKAMRVHPAFDGTVDRGALALFLRFGHIDHPHSIHERFRKVPPATIVTIRAGRAESLAYWSLREIAERGETAPFEGDVEDALDELEALLSDSVRLRMIADVPLGAFLSGGIDSSLIVSLMQRLSSRPVRTFTIGFSEQAYNEADHARSVAAHLGTEHTEAIASPEDAMAVIPLLPAIYDEPCGDPSAIPTYLVSRLARQSVTVSLSGDAGDELFGGYNRYISGSSWWRRTRLLPRGVRRAAARGIELLSVDQWQRSFSAAARALPRRLRYLSAGEKIHKLARVLRADDVEGAYTSLVRHWENVPDLTTADDGVPAALDAVQLSDFACRAMYRDMVSYLPSDILVKLDRATMAVSLEGRVPFLDPRVIELAWRLPLRWKVRGNEGKWILRRLLYRHVPERLVNRPKAGFGVPLDRWLRGPLRPWAEALLDEARLRREGFINPVPVRSRWRELLAGRGMWQFDLWNVLMFQAWLEYQTRSAPQSVAAAVVG